MTPEEKAERRALAVRMNDHEAVDLIDRITTIQQEKAALEVERDEANGAYRAVLLDRQQLVGKTRRLGDALILMTFRATEAEADVRRLREALEMTRDYLALRGYDAAKGEVAKALAATPDGQS